MSCRKSRCFSSLSFSHVRVNWALCVLVMKRTAPAMINFSVLLVRGVYRSNEIELRTCVLEQG